MPDTFSPALFDRRPTPAPTPSPTVPSNDSVDLVRVSEGLPVIFVNLLERRYMASLGDATWDFRQSPYTNVPLLHEVLALGTPRHKSEWSAAMSHVLTGCHEPGNAIVTALYGDGTRPHLYVGARRLIGGGGRSTEDFLKNAEGAFKAYFNGLTLSPHSTSLCREEMPELTEFLEAAPALSAISGIPSPRRISVEVPFDLQSVDQLVKAVGPRRYALMVVAEPIQPEEIDRTIDVCRRLIGFVHAFAGYTRNKGSSHSTTTREGDPAQTDSTTNFVSGTKLTLGTISTVLSMAVPGHGALRLFSGAAHLLGMFDGEHTRQNKMHEREVPLVKDRNDGMTEGMSANFIDANAEACEKMLRQYLARIEAAKSNGWWRTAVYLAAENEAVLATVEGALRTLCAGENTALDPIRVLEAPEETLREAMLRGGILALRPREGTHGHPFGESFDMLGTCLTSEELSILVNLPRTEIPGIPMRDLGEFGLSMVPGPSPSITLGSLQDSQGRRLAPVVLSAKTLNRHVFVTGTTGYGKTNTCWQLLIQSYLHLDVPFLVIEPAKAEYHRLVQVPELRHKLRVYNVGGGNGVSLRINPFDWVPGIPLLRHINILKAIFGSSVFPTGEDSPFPYIVESALYEVYLERGWNLHTSENPDVRPNSLQDRCAALPTMDDFARKAEEILRRRDYDAPTQQRLLGALTVRMRSLITGLKGLSLNTRRSTPLRHLFGVPAIVELSNVGNEDEKAFLMALLFSLLYQDAEVRAKSRPAHLPESLQHLTLIEEAHCLLKATGQRRTADPAAKAVDMFSDMLAEMRAYGEGFIIADQIPTKLAPDILKNTGLKIIHRLADPSERKVAGDCINLNEWQVKHLNNLSEGVAATHFEQSSEPILCYVPLVKNLAPKLTESEIVALAEEQNRSESYHLQKHAGCSECPAPCKFYDKFDTAAQNYAFSKGPGLAAERSSAAKPPTPGQAARTPAVPLFETTSTSGDLVAVLGEALVPVLQNLLLDRSEDAFTQFSAWQRRAAAHVRGMQDASGAVVPGVAYCVATQAAYHVLGEFARNRGLAVLGARLAMPQDLIRREDAASALAKIFIAWIEAPGYVEPPADAVRTWRETAFGAPPPVLAANPICEQCPLRCHLLPFTSPYLRPALADLRRQRLAGGSTSPARGTAPLPGAINQALKMCSRLDPGGKVTLNCLLSQLDGIVEALPEDAEDLAELDLRQRLETALAKSDFSPETPPK